MIVDTPGETRCLQYETAEPVVVGLLHHTRNLCHLLCEAHVTARLAILPALDLNPMHNFGLRREWRWEHYYDFGASSLTDAAGRQYPLPIANRPPGEGVRTLKLPGGAPMPDRARRYPLVVRRIADSFFERELPVDAWSEITVDLRPSGRAMALARPVVRRLRSLGGGCFVAVHVRRGDQIAKGKIPDWLTRPAHVGRFLRDRGVAGGTVVYIASNEREPGFWKPLEETWRVLHHADFPSLEALVSGAVGDGEGKPDNYLLFQVEQAVLREGSLRIGTVPNEAWGWMHDWLMDRKHWPRPGFRRRLLQAGMLRIRTPIRRLERRLPPKLRKRLARARRVAWQAVFMPPPPGDGDGTPHSRASDESRPPPHHASRGSDRRSSPPCAPENTDRSETRRS